MKKAVLILLVGFAFSGVFAQSSPTLHQIIQTFEKLNDDQNESAWPELDQLKAQRKASSYKLLLQQLSNLETSNAQERINKEMLQLIMRNYVASQEFGIEKMPLNAEGGFLAGVIYSIRGKRIGDEESFNKYVKQLEEMPNYFDKRIALMRQGIKEGKQSPKLIVQNCLKLLSIWEQKPFKKSIYSKPTKNKAYNENIAFLYSDRVIPSYKKMKKFLQEEYLPTAPEKEGVAFVNGGKAYYQARTKYFSTYDITPQEVFDTGTAEVKRIRAEMDAIIERLEFDGDFAEFLEFLRTDDQFYPESPDALLGKASHIAKEIEGELPKYFGTLTSLPFTVKPVPAALAPNYTSGRYSGGSWQNKKAGEYWVNTTKLNSRTLYTLPALTLHEAVPGHHLQIMLAQELKDLPDFRKTYLSAFGEGWALYGEYLGKEMGIYKTDYEDFGRLTYEMWRACRLVVDPAIHALGWSRAQAVEFMQSNTALSMHEVNTEIDRYIGWPAQAISYKLGEIKIRELRKMAEQKLGDTFDLRAFHDKILENGSVPLGALQSIIEKDIQNKLHPTNGAKGLVHTVYFWMKKNADHQAFEVALKELGTVPAIAHYYWGKPAATPKRDVIDDSYHYAINVFFDSPADQDAYQIDPIHQKFVKEFKDSFAKVKVYDNEIE